MSDKSRILELDSLRGIAALAVLLFHYTSRYDSLYGHSSDLIIKFDYGKFGYHFFFILSGFVILGSFERIKRGLDFIVGRFARIYPTYFVGVILTFLVIRVGWPPRSPKYVQEALINLTMLQEFFNVRHVDGVYWTLVIELSFYMIMFAIYRLRLLPWIEYICLSWLALSALENLYGRTESILPPLLNTLLIPQQAPLFILGIMMYLMYEKRGNWLTHTVFVLAFGVYLINRDIEQLWVIGLLLLVFWVAITERLKFLQFSPLLFLGSISYPLYLVHQNIGYFLIQKLYRLDLNVYFILALTTVVMLALSTALSYGVERPAMKWIRDRYKGKGKKTTPKLTA